MLTDEDLERIAMLLEAYGLEKKPSADALRMRRLRERQSEQKRNKGSNKSVTRKGLERNKGVTAERTPSAATWDAYSVAYLSRYGVEPTRNATVNGQLAQFVTRVPQAEAPQIAAFFVKHNKAFYVSSRHAVGALLRDAEGLRTEWLSGRTVTDTEARQADRTQATGNVFGALIAEARERDKRGTH